MRFNGEKAYSRFLECRAYAYEHGLENNFNNVFARLFGWEHYDENGNRKNEIVIGTDWYDKCFTFSERYATGEIGICGGIIFHGLKGEQENGSVSLNPEGGWQIHT